MAPTPFQGRNPDQNVGVEKVPATTITVAPELSSVDVDSKLEQLKNKVFSEIYKVADGLSTKTNTVYQAVSLTNKIDNLNKVTISDATISGSTYAGSIVGTSGAFSSSLSANGGLSATTGTFSGDLTVLGAPTFSGVLTIPYFTATSTTATSTIAGQFLNTFVPSIAHTFSSWSSGVSGSNPLTASMMINPASATADSNLLSLSVGDSAKFLIDAEGDVFANSITASGGVTLSTTTASTFSVENNSTFGDSTTTDRTYFNSRIGSSLIPNTNNLLDIGDITNWLSWRTGLFGTSVGVGGTATSTGSQLTASGNYLIDSGGVLSLNTTNNRNIVTGSGNFSIGTTSPYSKLSVWGGGTGTGQLFELTNSASTTVAKFLDNGTAYFLGNLGIGTTSPYAKLSVVGEAVAQYFTATSTTATSTFAGGLSAAGSSGLTVLQNGNVGIGTAGPASALHVKNATYPQIQFDDNTSRNFAIGVTASSFRVRDVTGSADRLTIDVSGNVGIGTTSPGYKLDVNGNLGVNTVYVAAANKIFQSRNDATLEYAQEYNRNGSRIGGIYLDASTVQYITSSDIRLKDNIQDLQGAISLVRSIKPRTFSWKTTGLNDIGFVAQELETVFPQAVTKTTNPDDLKGVDYGRITPLLAGAINNITSVIDLTNATTTFVSMYIDPFGNVGIGTTTPAYKLHVLGDIAAQSFVNISTRDSKKDISYLSDTDNETMLEKLKNLFVARYHYETEDVSAPMRTGLIAEEAPEEILAAGGKGVDLYKFVAFLTSGVKALIAKVDAIIAKVASFANVFTTQKLCVGNTCVTETELQALLAGIGSPGSSAPITTTDSASSPQTTDTATTTTETTSTTTESSI